MYEMANKSQIYKEEGAFPDEKMFNQLQAAVDELEYRMRASQPIQRDGNRVGFGVNKVQRGIAADSVISIVRAIKSLKGW